MSTATAFQELAATASVICREIDLCNRLAHALHSEQWDDEQLGLVINTYTAGTMQLMFAQRELMLHVIDTEMAAEQATAI